MNALFRKRTPASKGLSLAAMGSVPGVIEFWGADRDGLAVSAYLTAHVWQRSAGFGARQKVSLLPIDVYSFLCNFDDYFHNKPSSFILDYEQAKVFFDNDANSAAERFYDYLQKFEQFGVERRSFLITIPKFQFSIDQIIMQKSGEWKRGS